MTNPSLSNGVRADGLRTNEVRVWDPVVRLFHWSLALAVLICLVTGDEILRLHVLAGYAVGLLVLLRVVWGVVGPRTARFADFVTRPRQAIGYLRDMVAFRSRRHLGHSPAGGAMVVALLVTLTCQILTGLAVYGAEEHAGPLASLFAGAGLGLRGLLAGLHGLLGNLLWVLIAVHLAGVALASLVHRENLVKAMFTGRKSL